MITFTTKKDRIYRVWLKEIYAEDKVFFNSNTPLIFESVLEENFPEIEKAIQRDNNRYLVGEEDKRFNEIVGIISSDFFEVFDFPHCQRLSGRSTSQQK